MIMRSVVNAIDRINTWTGKAISFLVFVMTAVLCWEIFGRGLFDSPTIWAHELTGYFFGAYFMLGGAYTLKNGGHINVDILYTKLSAKKRAVVDIVSSLLIMLFLFVLLWFSFNLMITQLNRHEVSQTVFAPPVFPLSLFIVVGSIMFLLQAFAKLVRSVYLVAKGKDFDSLANPDVQERESK